MSIGDKSLREDEVDLSEVSELVDFLIMQDIKRYLPAWVREALGVNVDKLGRRVVEGVGEFDGYAEFGDKVIVAKIMVTLRLRDVRDFVEKVNRLRQSMAGKEVIAIIAHVFKGRGFNKAVELAKANGIKIIKHYGEEDFEEIT
ncbi:hypothetical protein [Vulcanisaeta sp. JCM 14467]|uniref:hypothetical protein n=1 Tax=Vulcanisaeta sp. JCM 14467 TaxID=1295370 RepID=UPI0006CFF172|nr:hypothetical protein [Vulcanisaeta sp. JCM 14467]